MAHIRLDQKTIFATYLDTENKIVGPTILISTLMERFEKYNPIYATAGKEVAPSTGTIHYHAVIICELNVRTKNGDELLKVEGILPHLERIRYGIRKIAEYCQKDGNFAEGGKKPWKELESKKEKNQRLLQGDLEQLYLNGDIGPVEIIRAEKIRAIFAKNSKPDKYRKRIVMWFKGETGEGKTRTAVEIAEKFYNGDYWISNDSLRWFDGYHGQKLAIIDDFRKAMLTDWSFLLRLLDGYNLIVQTKGGFTKWNPETIIITSPATPEEAFSWTNNEGETKQWDKANQLQRRLTHNDVDQIYNFPLWDEDKLKLENVFRKEFGMDLLAGENTVNEDWSVIEPEGFITPG